MLWIYISKNLDSLEIKVEEFLTEFKKGILLHIRRADFEVLKTSLTQSHLFCEYTHFIFEDYVGKLSELELLFKTINFSEVNILITFQAEYKLALSWELLNKLEDKNYWLYNPGILARERYLRLLLESSKLKLSSELVKLIREEVLFSCIQLKGVIEQLKIFSNSPSGEELSKEIVLGAIKSNKMFENLENPFTFLELYLSNQVKKWVFLLRKVSYSRDALFSFLKCFAYCLNSNFWNTSNSLEITNFIRELSYNFLIFIELTFVKIKKDSIWLVFHFFWRHKPKFKLNTNFLR